MNDEVEDVEDDDAEEEEEEDESEDEEEEEEEEEETRYGARKKNKGFNNFILDEAGTCVFQF